MSRRGRGGVAISLFSFQDIITCVSGIIIIVVLLLALELVERRVNGETTSQADVGRIAAAVSAMQAELEQKQAEAATSDQLLQELAAATPVELQQQREQLRARIAGLQQAIDEARARGNRAANERKTVEVERFENRDRQLELKQVQNTQQQLQEQIEQERQENRPIYSVPRGAGLSGWLVLVEEASISVAPLGRSSPPTIYVTKRLGPIAVQSASDQFLDWAKRQPRQAAYFLLVVRPEGLDEFELLEDRLSALSFRFGFDLVGADQVVLDAQRGAGE